MFCRISTSFPRKGDDAVKLWTIRGEKISGCCVVLLCGLKEQDLSNDVPVISYSEKYSGFVSQEEEL